MNVTFRPNRDFSIGNKMGLSFCLLILVASATVTTASQHCTASCTNGPSSWRDVDRGPPGKQGPKGRTGDKVSQT